MNSDQPNNLASAENTRNRGVCRWTVWYLGQLMVAAVVLIAPWWFGSVEANSQLVLFGAALLALVCALVSVVFDRSRSVRLPLATIALFAAILLVAFQLVPLKREVRRIVSPAAVVTSDSLLDTPGSESAQWLDALDETTTAVRRPISLYPASTRHDLALLVLAGTMFLLGAVFFARPQTHVWLLVTVAVNGGALAFFGIAQKLAWNGKLYWTFPLTQGGLPFGPFVNRNNAGGYLILCLAAAIGLAVWISGRLRHSLLVNSADAPYDDVNRRASPRTAYSWSLQTFLDARFLTAFTLVALLLAGVLISMSRGAMLATVVAAVLTFVAVWVFRRGSVPVGWAAVAVLLTIPLVSWVGLTGDIKGRLATLLDGDLVSKGRVPLWNDSMLAIADFWQAGSGLGTFRYVYPQYQERIADKWFYHAENQYLEAFIEGGLVGLSLMLILLALITWAALRILHRDNDMRAVALAVGGTFAIAGQAVAACFDFGLYIPSNTILFAVLCGALAGRATQLKLAQCSASQRFPVARWWAAATIAALLAGSAWGMSELKRDRQVEAALRATRLANATSDLSIPRLDEHIGQLNEAVVAAAEDADLHKTLAELYIQLYRARTLRDLQSKTSLAADAPQLQHLASPLVVHQRAHMLARTGMHEELDKQRSLPAVAECLLPALRHLARVREACPLLPEVHRGIAQLIWVAAEPWSDKTHVDRVRQLAPGDADLLYICGLLDLHAGRLDAALASWKQCLTLTPRYLDEVLAMVDRTLTVDGTIEKVLPDSPQLLLNLARKKFSEPRYEELREKLVQRARLLIRKTDVEERERQHLLATACAMCGEFDAAAEHFSNAVRNDPRNANLRHEFATVLWQAGRFEEVRVQATWSARLAPDQRRHQKLLTQIRKRQLSAP